MSYEYIRPSSSWKKRRFKWPFKPSKQLWKNVALACLALVVGGSLFGLAAFAWVSRDLPDPNKLLDREVEQSTKIYDRTGEHLLYEIHGNKNRTLVKLDDIPDVMVNATLAVEDQQFFKHSGFNPVRILKGVVLGVIFKGRAQGGSTITQQLVKNAILTNERSITRKLKEIILSIALEQRYTKEEILQLYFNEIPYGSTNYGVEAAAQAYFGKSVRDLTLAEAATLASLPKAPTTYLNNPDKLDARRDTVLELMWGEGYITKEEKTAAQDEEVSIREKVDGITAPHFVFYIKEQLVEKYGERQVEEGGLKVTTSLDYDKQLIAEEAVKAGVEARKDSYGFENASLVAIDPKTGQILSMVGSIDYFSDTIDGAVNVSTRPRQPGSSMKPFVYTAGFLAGYTANTILYDVETVFKTETTDYTPRNYSLNEAGPVTIRKALQGSLNIPAVKMLYLVGVQNFLDFAERLGYTTLGDRSRFGLSLVLGGGEVTLLEHTAAYGALAGEGKQYPTVSLLKVEDHDGNVLEEWKQESPREVIEQNAAREINNVLSDNGARAYVFGASNYLTLSGRAAAGKTGTTNDYRDAWMIGYTPSLVAGVWAGNNDNSEMVRGADGSKIAAPIWQDFMNRALATTPAEAFTAPEIPVTGKPILDGQLPSTTVTIDRASGKLATEETPESQRQEIVCGEYHSILHYVNPSDPLGPAPTDMSSDPQYLSWEAGIASWVERTRLTDPTKLPFEQCTVPTETDDVHTRQNEPDISILSPDKNDEVGRTIRVEIEADAPRGVERVEYAIDGRFVKSSDSRAGTMLTLPSWVDVGDHTLQVTAYDDVDNAGSDSVKIKVTEEAGEANVGILEPLNGQTIEKTTDTFAVTVQLKHPTNLTNVSLFVEPLRGGTTTLVGSIDSPSSPFATFNWTLGSADDYVLWARIDSEDGDREESASILVTVTDTGSSLPPVLDITESEESDTDAEPEGAAEGVL